MNAPAIIALLTGNYNVFTRYINGLTAEEYTFICDQKWTAGQQLNHIVLCVKPLVQVFGMERSAIEQSFGRSNRQSCSYDELLKRYLVKLKEGGKAPTRYLPETAAPDQRAELTGTLEKMVKDLCVKIENFTEEDLDGLNIPHPLLGNLTMREMLYNACYHVEHHRQQAIQNLEKK